MAGRSLVQPAGTEERAFLGVAQSVTGKTWRDRCDLRAAQTALAIHQRYDIPEVLARIVACRGVGLDDVENFLEPSIRNLMPDPLKLTGMAEAAGRLADATERKEQIAVFGDYDVDGATSTALLVRVLRAAGLDPLFHIPDRQFEGYGPNIEAIRKLAEKGATLLVTVDCGTTSHEALAEANRLGMDAIVIDHHQAPDDLPYAYAIVNPHRADDISGLGQLSAVGLVFMTAAALLRELRRRDYWGGSLPEPDLLQHLDLVALGTVADVVPLTGLNRAFVKKGLIVLRNRQNEGLRALMDVARLDGPPSPYHLGFLLGPRINAGGRIGDATLGTRLLVTDDPAEANRIALELDRLNRERQTVERATLEQAEAEAFAALGLEERGAVVIASGDGWHPGVVGLVAARLKERFGRPAFAIAMLGDTGTGSARSIPGVDLGRAVRSAMVEGLLVKGGGHAMAAGLTISRDKMGAFRAFIEKELTEYVEQARAEDTFQIDAAITARGANHELVEMIERASPYGSGNPEPVFAFPSHIVAYADPVGEAHVRVRLRAADGAALDAIAFRCLERPLGQALRAARGQTMHVAGCLTVDRWQGRERIQLRILDAAPGDPLSAR
jgi:single-stranded-DNA-specific exonuclease